MIKFAGTMLKTGQTCPECGIVIYRGEYVIQTGLFHRTWYHNACWQEYCKNLGER
jgi:hypothetical protein